MWQSRKLSLQNRKKLILLLYKLNVEQGIKEIFQPAINALIALTSLLSIAVYLVLPNTPLRFPIALGTALNITILFKTILNLMQKIAQPNNNTNYFG